MNPIDADGLASLVSQFWRQGQLVKRRRLSEAPTLITSGDTHASLPQSLQQPRRRKDPVSTTCPPHHSEEKRAMGDETSMCMVVTGSWTSPSAVKTCR